MNHSDKTYIFTRAQIASGDVSGFLGRFNPDKLSSAELAGLCGALRIRLQEPISTQEIFADLLGRRFFRRLHASFPYSGYFLRLHPLRSLKPSPSWIDADLFFAIGLCNTDIIQARWDRLGQEVTLFRPEAFAAFMADIDHHIARIGKRAGLTAPAIRYRRTVVTRTIRSLLRLRELKMVRQTP
jgi:hypothetical protein